MSAFLFVSLLYGVGWCCPLMRWLVWCVGVMWGDGSTGNNDLVEMGMEEWVGKFVDDDDNWSSHVKSCETSDHFLTIIWLLLHVFCVLWWMRLSKRSTVHSCRIYVSRLWTGEARVVGKRKEKKGGMCVGKEKVKTSHTRFSKLKRGDSGG